MSPTLSVCLQTLCALVSQDEAKQRWLQGTAILGLLHCLTLQDPTANERPPQAAGSNPLSQSSHAPLGMERQSARIIAMITADANCQSGIRCGVHQSFECVRTATPPSATSGCSCAKIKGSSPYFWNYYLAELSLNCPILIATGLEQSAASKLKKQRG